MDVSEALERLGGIADRQALLRLASRSAIEAAVDAGDVVRLGRSRLALPAADDARIAAAQARGVVSHVSAALAHGWKVKAPPKAPHVTVRRTRGRVDARGTSLHWGEVSDSELVAGVTDPVRTVVDCARALPFDVALAVADSALRSGSVRRARGSRTRSSRCSARSRTKCPGSTSSRRAVSVPSAMPT